MASQSQNLTDYERKRLDNIRRNDEMMAALKLHSTAALLLSKRPRVATKPHNSKSELKKPKIETPTVIRRSLRTRGIPPPDSFKYNLASVNSNPSPIESPIKIEPCIKSSGPVTLTDAYCSNSSTPSDRSFIDSIVGAAKNEAFDSSVEVNSESSLKLESLCLEPENIGRLLYRRITAMQFFPLSGARKIVAANEYGNIAFWNVGDSDTIDGEPRVYLYHPHSAYISGVLVQQHCISKIYSSCHDGSVRLMDAEKEIFDLVFSSDERIYSLSQPKNEANCLYFGEGGGGLSLWDSRIGKCQSQWVLHEDRINTIDFNCENPHIVATSSSDGTACTWDLRFVDDDKLRALGRYTHKRAVQSAYFSPSGRSLATTSMDDTIRIYSGVNWEDTSTVHHDNQTGVWVIPFRAKWGWDDAYLFVGNFKRYVDVVSASQRKTVMSLESPHISAIPCRFDVHPYEVGTLAASTSGGQVYVWTSC